ncbi:MAG: hypothetical protein Fur006_26240 [Coleofasciculaceae cyanobacterium]
MKRLHRRVSQQRSLWCKQIFCGFRVYTSYDLSTLLKAKTGGTLGVVVGTGDTLVGQTSRIDVAAACVECIDNPVTAGKVFEIVNQGSRPSAIDWTALFSHLG